jgi:Fic family protein
MVNIFRQSDLEKVSFILDNSYNKLSNLISKNIQNLAVAWSYYSGKIEGNTYSFVETDLLLTDGITSTKKMEDAVMLKNLYNTFISQIECAKAGNTQDINVTTLLSLHKSITAGLLHEEQSGRLRQEPVFINGTNYVPPKTAIELQDKLEQILKLQTEYKNPLEKAIFSHCNIAKLQPFRDGNKRTSRIVESIVLMNNNIIPVYSTKEEDIVNYKKCLLYFYETNDYSEYKDYFLNRQIERINQIVPEQFRFVKGKDNGMSI